MRTIKFRAETLYNYLIYFELHKSILSGDSDVFYVKGVPCKPGTEQLFVGLLDCEKKEIYEGDILHASGENLITGHYNKKAHITKDIAMVVLFKDGRYWIKKSKKRAKKHLLFGLPILQNSLMIIGNIYENPELLK